MKRAFWPLPPETELIRRLVVVPRLVVVAPTDSSTQPPCRRSSMGTSGSDHFPPSILIQPSSSLLLSCCSCFSFVVSTQVFTGWLAGHRSCHHLVEPWAKSCAYLRVLPAHVAECGCCTAHWCRQVYGRSIPTICCVCLCARALLGDRTNREVQLWVVWAMAKNCACLHACLCALKALICSSTR